MHPIIEEVSTARTPESLAALFREESGTVLLRSLPGEAWANETRGSAARYSFLAVRPFLTFRSFGSRCEIAHPAAGISQPVQFGNPWRIIESLVSRYELLDEVDLPFPLGGCFGYWGYDLKNFVEPKLPHRAANDLELPHCCLGFYDSLVAFDHRLGKAWIISTGLDVDGSRFEERAKTRLAFLKERLTVKPHAENSDDLDQFKLSCRERQFAPFNSASIQIAPTDVVGHICFEKALAAPRGDGDDRDGRDTRYTSNLSRGAFLSRVQKVLRYIHAGDIYQVNLSQRLSASCECDAWDLFESLCAISPAPFAGFSNCGDFQIVSSSPEQFLRMNGSHIQTRPVKGTRPRSHDPTRDAQLTYELQTSSKEMAELVMITDLLRNDLGKICEFGSVQVPDLARLEKFSQVQHLVSTVEGRLCGDVTHLQALASCFPGGSITGAPKFRAMEIIDELETVARGPYTGALGYLGFNRESQLSITIRTAVCKDGMAHFNVGAGIVADSNPVAEYEETLAKAAGFLEAMRLARLRVANRT